MKKLLKKRRVKEDAPPSRITNETVAEHRERILAGGRRYKYPMQYARHRLVIVTVSLVATALLAVGLLGWWQLYVAQSRATILYRVTQILSLPVASVDGQSVKYSDYLMYYNSSIHYLQNSGELTGTEKNISDQFEFQKRKNLDIALRYAYAEKLAKELGITVEQEELDRVNQEHLILDNGPISQETYNASTMNVLGWTPEEEQRSTRSQILKNKVAYEIDEDAEQKTKTAAKLLETNGNDFDATAKVLGGEVRALVSGPVPLVNNDGGLAKAAQKLEVGQISPVLRTSNGDGYYFVKLIEKSDTKLNYGFLQIPLTEFDKRLSDLKKNGRVREYIKVNQIEEQNKQE